jgi:cbb3-type cytochrome oxidase subunit 1
MDTILSIFEFTSQSLALLFARFGIELLCTLVVAYLVALILLQVTKKKDHEIGFSNWYKVCFMYGIDVAIATLGVIVILTIRTNGLHYFTREAISWSWYCGYLLMCPEFLLMLVLVAFYVLLDQQVKNSIK